MDMVHYKKEQKLKAQEKRNDNRPKIKKTQKYVHMNCNSHLDE